MMDNSVPAHDFKERPVFVIEAAGDEHTYLKVRCCCCCVVMVVVVVVAAAALVTHGSGSSSGSYVSL